MRNFFSRLGSNEKNNYNDIINNRYGFNANCLLSKPLVISSKYTTGQCGLEGEHSKIAQRDV